MNSHLQTILEFIQQNEDIPAEEKEALLKAAKKVKSDLEIAEFKLERTEKVKRTTAILLEETIEELEQKRKAIEAQRRDLEIEASLERVRTSAMSMRSSENLFEVIHVLREQMAALDEKELESIIIHIYKEGSEDFEAWFSYRHASDPESKIIHGKVNLNWTSTARARRDKEKYYTEGETEYTIVADYPMLKEWYEYLYEVVPAEVVKLDEDGNILVPDELHYNYSKFPGGAMLLITNKVATEDSKRLLKRSAEVFNLAYTRFQDLQKAEVQAREAVKQSSLDRIRAEIASMRSNEDLLRITPVIWGELTTLEVPFSRCGVFIIDENENRVTVYLSAPDGHSLGIMNLHLSAHPIIINIVGSWRKNQVFTEHWNKKDFADWMQSMIEQGQIRDKETYQGSGNPPESLNLHFVPFSQGMIYVGNSEPLSQAQIDLVASLAEAFSIAYARYEDFNKLELAKQQIEKTLVDLKQAQSQLIHSEKMASLGELTAGIAHEIQNPLNFVNNFSEVSTELVDEMNEAIVKGNLEDATMISADLKQNLEKINIHGKRAGEIVKSMLQHSRTSSGQKEPTDINALVDEYLRLAYHGFRAKDKSFNAIMKTVLDDKLPKINVIPQDIGRVVLNLITNAFYVVNEKSQACIKDGKPGYEPTITVSTALARDQVRISVSDNGNGIPRNLVGKIFQPFFSTKPTGKGTGLGLSLSYDIVTKAHNGTLEVTTSEGEGSTFIILLPI